MLCCILEESCRGAFVILEFLYSTAKYGVSLRKVARNSASCKSVIASGNATFQENLDLETTNLHKNHLLDLWFTRKTKNMIPFLSISLAFIKSGLSADFLSEIVGYFGNLSRMLPKSIFSIASYCLIWLIAKKVKTRNFSSFFSAFRLFVQNRKKSTFFRFICSALLIDSYQNSVGLDFLRRLSIGDPPPPPWKWYQRSTESSKNKQKIQGDQQNFPEVRTGFCERNLRLFCSKHELTKMSEPEIDTIIKDCVSDWR